MDRNGDHAPFPPPASRFPLRASARGGRRPGAGAPPGNLNALKHGRRSAQLRQLFVALKRAGVRATLGRVLGAAAIARAGLVAVRHQRRIRGGPSDSDQAGHQEQP